MAFIAFLGCDGSSKSAVISEIAARCRQDGTEVVVGHWRPRAFRTDTAGAKVPADNPHGERPRGIISSFLKLMWLGFNWWAGWWTGLGKASRKGLVLFDRYHGDLLVDPQRYRYGGPLVLARMLTRCMPQPDLVVFLDAAPEVLLSRKQEVSHEALEKSRERYLQLCRGNSRCAVVDASLPLEEVTKLVIEQIGSA